LKIILHIYNLQKECDLSGVYKIKKLPLRACIDQLKCIEEGKYGNQLSGLFNDKMHYNNEENNHYYMDYKLFR
jgi:hypothetical protein